jgi:hypothetical protein
VFTLNRKPISCTVTGDIDCCAGDRIFYRCAIAVSGNTQCATVAKIGAIKRVVSQRVIKKEFVKAAIR